MRTRKLLSHLHYLILVVACTSQMVLPTSASERLHYGMRSDVLQPVYSFKNGLWYSNLHMQIPSMDQHDDCWLVGVGSGVRSLVTPYFIFGAYTSISQLNSTLGKSYWLNPSIECWFPSAQLGIHTYWMMHHIASQASVDSAKSFSFVKRAIDIKLSGTILPFVRPFISTHYLARDDHNRGSLKFASGVEWLMTARCSLELQYNLSQSDFLVRVKFHSPKIYQAFRRNHVLRYLREPVDQHILSVVSFNAMEVEAMPSKKIVTADFSSPALTQPTLYPSVSNKANTIQRSASLSDIHEIKAQNDIQPDKSVFNKTASVLEKNDSLLPKVAFANVSSRWPKSSPAKPWLPPGASNTAVSANVATIAPVELEGSISTYKQPTLQRAHTVHYTRGMQHTSAADNTQPKDHRFIKKSLTVLNTNKPKKGSIARNSLLSPSSPVKNYAPTNAAEDSLPAHTEPSDIK